ncbi:MAG: SDR family oxidoreductase [Armatimonadota bacterium]
MPASFDLTGRVAVVTGAARGLGAGIAVALAAAGADIVAVDRDDPGETLARCREQGVRAYPLLRDLAFLDAIGAEALLETARELAGATPDILCHAAGFIRRAPAESTSDDDWSAVVAIHLDTAFALSRAFGARWLAEERTGKIILVASMLTWFGGRHAVAYAAAKSGLGGLTRALAAEWAGRGINVNALAPGWFETDLTAALRADPDRETAIRTRIPAGRWGRPDDLAGATVFLASPASDYIHGVVLPVDGGYRIG